LKNSKATHVITGIIWGANIAAIFEQVAQNPEKVKDIEDKLSLVLKGLPISDKTKLTKADKNKLKFESLQISF
jgi:type II secretory pathway component PulC